MNLYDSKTWISDLDEVIQTLPELSALQGARVMITGCTGLICSAVCDILIRWNETHERKIGLLAAGRNEQRVRARFAPYDQREWFAFVPYDAASPEAMSGFRCDYIIHGASNASPDRIVQEPVHLLFRE